MAPALFVSDLHLCPTRPQVVAQFDDFLAGTATAAGALSILGDLFEYWAGDDDLCAEFNSAVAGSLRRLVAIRDDVRPATQAPYLR